MVTDQKTETSLLTPSVTYVAILWQQRLKTNFGVEKPLTSKECGQLKMLRNSLGLLTLKVIIRTLDSWQEFCNETRYESGLPCSPAFPHIGFLLAHYDAALRWYEKSIAEKSFHNPKPTQAVETVYNTPEAAEPDIEHMTWAEKQAMWAEWKKQDEAEVK
jgi:hypothetical protein